MIASVLAVLIDLSAASHITPRISAAAAQSPPVVECSEWPVCRMQALAAADSGDNERFHDLAWRAVQTGPRNNPDLMYLLARAQAASGRPHDALVMLGRLADIGYAPAAAAMTGEEFARVRALPQWPEVEAHIAAAAAGQPLPSMTAPAASTLPPATSPAAVTSTASGAAAAPSLPVVMLAAGPQPVRFSMRPFIVSGLGYDALSRRFVVGDRLGRRLIAVDEGANQPIDLVRSDSAGFLDIAAVEIDGKRGDLWVVSGGTVGNTDGAGTLHRLQLVSGRPLRAFAVGADQQPVKLVDLAITVDDTVLVLDAMTPQLLMLRPRGTALERALKIDVSEPTSVTAGGQDNVAFVSHRDGISRVDLRTRTVSLLTWPTAAAGVPRSSDPVERIRWQRNALLAVQAGPNGARQVLRLDLNASGTAISKVTHLDAPASPAPATSAATQTFMTVSSDELVYVTSDQSEFVVHRVPLR